MKGPRRLIEQNELFASLVEDANRREPGPEALQQLLDVLDAPAIDPSAATARPRAPFRAPAPWICLALVGAGALSVLGYHALDRSREATPSVVAAAPATAAAPLATAIPEPTPETVPSVPISELPDSTEPPARVRPVAARAAGSQAASSAESRTRATKPAAGREIELIARAREALTRGDARACLAALAQHDAEFPDGQLMPEAAVMRIEATHASGDRAGARTLARAFLAKSPDSPYAARVRSLLATLEQE